MIKTRRDSMAFPEGFLLGAATAAHQVEGNNIHSDCWVMEQVRHSDFAEPSGKAVDHYHRYEEDIRLLAQAGLNAYRFGIEWARIEPQEGRFDKAEVDHYRAVLACCKKYHVTPVVTLHHFSSPAWLIGKGGWAKPYVVRAFARYAAYVAEQLGEELPWVCTINEANMGGQLNKIVADMMSARKKKGAVQVGTAEGLNLKRLLLGMFEQGKAFHCSPFAINNFLKPRKPDQEAIVMQAHSEAVQAFKKVAPQTKLGLTLSLFDYQPTPAGKQTAVRLWQEDFGFYLPYIQNDDFLGVQNYSRKIVDGTGAREPAVDAPVTQMGYEDYPASIGHVVRKVAAQFKGDLLVTENGISTDNDVRRCDFIREAVAGVQQCAADGIPIKGYFYWSLLDNFEWQAGYAKTFGLIAVDRTTQKRIPKHSLQVLGDLAQKGYADEPHGME